MKKGESSLDVKIIDEELRIINNRLVTSSYLEDRITAISALKTIAERNPNVVGIHSMSSVIESMQHFVHKNHFIILEYIFRSFNGTEFKEIFLKEERYIKILINARNKRGTHILIVLAEIDYMKVSSVFLSSKDLFNYFIKIDDQILKLVNCLSKNIEFKKRILKNNLFDNILLCLSEQKFIKSCFITLMNLLRNSSMSQDIFFATEWKSVLEPYMYTIPNHYFNLITLLMDSKNINFTNIQQKFNDPFILEKAIEMKRYDFLLMYYHNRSGLDDIMKNADYYTLFITCEKKKQLLDIFLQIKTTYTIHSVEFNNDFSCYFVACYFYKNYYETNYSTLYEIADMLLDGPKIIETCQNLVNNCDQTSNVLESNDQKNNDSILFSNTSGSHFKSDRNENDDMITDVIVDICSSLDAIFSNFERTLTFKIGFFVLLNLLKIKITYSQLHINMMLSMLKSETEHSIIKGLIVLLTGNACFDGNREEYLLHHMYETRINLCSKDNLLHDKISEMLCVLATKKIDMLKEKIISRTPVTIDISDDVVECIHKDNSIFTKPSPKDVFKTMISNVSSKFATSEEDDSFNL